MRTSDELPNAHRVDGLRWERSGDVGVVTIDRPPHNFFDLELIRGVADAYDALAADGARSLFVHSRGRNFCAGAQHLTGGGETRIPSRDDLAAFYAQAVRLYDSGIPVVAGVQGAAVGGGVGLALSADFRVGEETSRFHANFSQLGLFPGFGTTASLPALVGPHRAYELLATGRPVHGPEAASIGLVDRLVTHGEVEREGFALAAELAGRAPLSVRAIRSSARAELIDEIRSAVERELDEQMALWPTHDFSEGVRAAAERREPRFLGR